jgi:Kdo2-lipid IVA lauroyltransferase/acyltransferase
MAMTDHLDAQAPEAAVPGLSWRVALAAVGLWLLGSLPRAARLWLSRNAVGLVLSTNRKRYSIIRRNLYAAFPELTVKGRREISRDFTRRIIYSALALVRIWKSPGQVTELVTLKGGEHLALAQQTGRPLILLAPHSVGLELGGALLTTQFPMLGLASEIRGEVGQWFFRAMRTHFCNDVVYRREGMRPVLRLMRTGRILYLLADEDHGARGRCFYVPFFGRPSAIATGTGRLVTLHDPLVLPCATLLDESTGVFEVVIEAPLNSFGDDPETNCQLMRVELERMIRMSPGDFLWGQRIFHHQPGLRSGELYHPKQAWKQYRRIRDERSGSLSTTESPPDP